MGAFATTVITILVLILAIQELTKVWLNEISNLQTEILYLDLEEAGPINTHERDFNFGVVLSKELTPDLGVLNFSHTVRKWQDDGGNVKNRQPFKMKRCGNTFKGNGVQSFEDWLCPDYEGAPVEHLNFQGEWFSQTFAYIDIKLTLCTEGATNPLTEQPFTNCKNTTEIEEAL